MTVTTPRPATAADVPAIHRLTRGLAEYERLLHRFTATEADLAAMLFGPDASARALVAGDPPTGIAVYYYTISTFSGRRGIFLEDLFVEPDHRGTGLGLALLRRLAEIAVEENCTGIEWRVLNWNQPAIDFYQRLGARMMTDWHVRQLDGDALIALAKGRSDG
jgi:GNAT superfamily N-acetyltransferase